MTSDNKYHVLLVTDDYETMELLQQTFIRANFRLLMATNFEEVVSNMQTEMPDLVVCDTDVKDVDRDKLQQHMPDNLELDTLPFIFLYSAGFGQELSWNLNSDQYLSKPFDPIALAAFAHWVLAHRKSLDQFAGANRHPAVVNRKILRKEVERELERIQRHGGNMSLCAFDIVGQPNGGVLPVPVSVSVIFNKVAEALPEMIRTISFLARTGRRSFLWVMPETDARGAELALRRLTADFGKIAIVDILAPWTIRAGLVTAPGDGLDYDELVDSAERKLTEHPIIPCQPV